jgi:hypothetical protein
MTDTPDYIDFLISDLLARPLVGAINHDVYDSRIIPETAERTDIAEWPYPPFTYLPRCVYFYYVRFDRDGALRVDHYFYPNGPENDPTQWRPIGPADIGPIMANLAINARPSTTVKNPDKLPHHNFEHIVWRRVSYIGIFVDEEHWKLHKRGHAKGALVFNTQKLSVPNSSFFDAQDIELDMPLSRGGSDKRTAIYFINHMTIEKPDGSVAIEQGSSEYVFDVYFDVAYADPAAKSAVIVLDPTGTNQGPPQEP